MDKESLKYIFWQWAELTLPSCLPRDLQLPLRSGKVICLVGVRRTGKTFLLFQTMQRLMADQVDPRQIIYLNFEDDRLYPASSDQLDLILQAHGELYPEISEQERFIFLDEVQAVPGWERFVRRVHDTENVQFFLTGSSSELLARELAPALRGRSIFFEVNPLSFPEFVRFKGLEYTQYSRPSEFRMVHALIEYVQWGGMPELVLAESAMRPLILEEYVSLMFYKDLLERFDIRNEPVLRFLLKTCCSQPASLLSVHKLYKDLKSMGFKASKNTVYEYLHCLQEAHILYALPLYTKSVRKQEQQPKKYHLVDVGLSRAYRADPNADLGHKLENLVFCHERSKGFPVYYYRNQQELDLIIESQPLCYLNVTWSLAWPNALQRETAAMEHAKRIFPAGQGALICHEQGPVQDKHSFRVLPAWRYLLGDG